MNTQSDTHHITPDTPAASEENQLQNIVSNALMYEMQDELAIKYLFVSNAANNPAPLGLQFQRDEALEALTGRRESSPHMARMLWSEARIVAVLLQEVISIHPSLSQDEGINQRERRRGFNAITLLKTIAIDPVIRETFLRSHFLLYLYPFLHTAYSSFSDRYLRLTSLGLVGSMLQTDPPTIVHFLITLEFIPECLAALDHGKEVSATFATYIIGKILEDREGLMYMTDVREKSFAILGSLANSVDKVMLCSSSRLLKQMLRCYIRITDHHSTRAALQEVFPPALMDRTFERLVEIDPTLLKLFERLFAKKGIPSHFRGNSFFVARIPHIAEPNFAASSVQPHTVDNDCGYSEFDALVDFFVNKIE